MSHRKYDVIVRGLVFGRSKDEIAYLLLDDHVFCEDVNFNVHVNEVGYSEKLNLKYAYPKVKCTTTWQPKFNYDYRVQLRTKLKEIQIDGIVGKITLDNERYILKVRAANSLVNANKR